MITTEVFVIQSASSSILLNFARQNSILVPKLPKTYHQILTDGL